jgi:glycosyltransferase involved in cell wall biosynthesis
MARSPAALKRQRESQPDPPPAELAPAELAPDLPPLPEELDALAALFAEAHTLFFDIGTLRESQFTGIPNVAANLAREVMAAGLPCHFFIGENIIRPEFVQFLLDTNRGACFGYHHQLGEAMEGPLLARVAATPRSVGLFPAEKPFHRLFDVELQVLHDFSTLATPYFHLRATNELHGARLLADIASNDFNFCVSTSTAEYLKRLAPAAANQVAVSLNGVRWPEHFAAQAEELFGSLSFEPFVVVLGTLEPRKNLEIIFRALAQDRDLMRRYRFIFMGKEGWLFDFGNTVKRHLGEMPENFTYAGFVSEFKKYCLLRFARFSIYPSLFEGFGLPILESFSVGVPVAYSASSSMPEVAGDAGYVFPPESPEGLLAAVYRLEAEQAQNRGAVRDACLTRSEAFTWHRMLRTVLHETLGLERRRQ